MLRRKLSIAVVCLSLNGCSYVYDVLAAVQDGRLTFIADEGCVRQIEVRAEGDEVAQASAGDDQTRVSHGTFWFESIEHKDRCENRFPITYGMDLIGAQQEGLGHVAAKPLLREVIYLVNTTTGSTGYGGGRFIIHADGTIENLS